MAWMFTVDKKSDSKSCYWVRYRLNVQSIRLICLTHMVTEFFSERTVDEKIGISDHPHSEIRFCEK